MKIFCLILIVALCSYSAFCQQEERIYFTGISVSENTGQVYDSWLNDDLNDLVPNAWENNFKWVDVTLQLSKRTLINRLSFYDFEGVFDTNPAYIYALNGTQKVYLGKFEGLTYKTFVDLIPNLKCYADAIIIHKYSNNIPQKIQVFGIPVTSPNTPSLPEFKLPVASIIPSENTGQDYSAWLVDNLDSLVPNVWENNFKYVDVTLKLAQQSLISRINFYDYEGVFTDNPASIYLQKGKTLTYVGLFEGLSYKTFVDIILPEQMVADAIVIHKYSNNIPQKVNIYGQQSEIDPIDTIPKPEGRLSIKQIVADPQTGMNYQPWLTDNLDSLVQGSWTASNFTYTDVDIELQQKSMVGRISLFDWEGVFNEHPSYLYARVDTGNVLLGTFIGDSYNTFTQIPIPDSIITGHIIVRKYGNDIPQKVKLYGRVITDTIVGVSNLVPASYVKIPISGSRWFQLNNCSNGLQGLSDGDTLTRVETGWGKVLSNYDAYYPVEKGEEISISKIKFFDGEGSLGPYPLTLSIINGAGKKIQVGTFTGSRYNEWVGPVPESTVAGDQKFQLDSTIHDVKYLVINCWYGYPNEIELYGSYKVTTTATSPAPTAGKFKNAIGINAFEWDFENPVDPFNIDAGRFNALKNFSGVRHYIDWEKLESVEGSYTFSPVHSGGWNYDTIYQACKDSGIEVLACIKTIPGWMQNTYPDDQKDAENVPVRYGSDFSNPNSYIEQSKLAFQFAARYGSNISVDRSLLSVNSSPRWTDDQINSVKIGLGLIKYIECDNERDKWWKGRKAYQTSFEYAANLSAFYDGNKNTMGPGVGVKNADPQMKVVMGGLASANTEYLRGMIEWCRINRGYKPDGTVDICWDVINYHYYSNDTKSSQATYSTRGAAPEKSGADSVALEFVKMAGNYAGGMPVWITELGYDLNQGSPFKAIPIGNKSEYQTQGDWLVRSALLYARTGVERAFFYQAYDDNFDSPGQFASMGLLNQNKTRRISADYLVQSKKILGEYSWKENISKDPLVDRYENNGNSVYVIYIPDEIGRTGNYDLSLPGTDSAVVFSLTGNSDSAISSKLLVSDGILALQVSETPIFVLPLQKKVYSISAAQQALYTSVSLQNNHDNSSGFKIYPNPSTDFVHLNYNSNDYGRVAIVVIQQSTGRIVKQINTDKSALVLDQVVDVSGFPAGIYTFKLVNLKHPAIGSLIKMER